MSEPAENGESPVHIRAHDRRAVEIARDPRSITEAEKEWDARLSVKRLLEEVVETPLYVPFTSNERAGAESRRMLSDAQALAGDFRTLLSQPTYSIRKARLEEIRDVFANFFQLLQASKHISSAENEEAKTWFQELRAAHERAIFLADAHKMQLFSARNRKVVASPVRVEDLKQVMERLDQVEVLVKATPVEDLQARLEEADEAVQQARRLAQVATEAASTLTLADHAKIFGTEAHEHEENANRWLWAAVILATLAAVGAIVFVFLPVSDEPGRFVQQLVARVVVLSLFVAAAGWAARTHRAHLNIAVQNRHRENAIASFEALVAKAIDPKTQDAVLMQATSSIYSMQPTGLVHDGGHAGADATLLGALAAGALSGRDRGG